MADKVAGRTPEHNTVENAAARERLLHKRHQEEQDKVTTQTPDSE